MNTAVTDPASADCGRGVSQFWTLANRFCSKTLPLANRHYNRQKPDSPQFAPPGSCLVLRHDTPAGADAFWITSVQKFQDHAWKGSWVCSAFRNESDIVSSMLIEDALACTAWRYGEPGPEGVITFVNPKKVQGVKRRGVTIYGYCFMCAGFEHIGFTKGGLWCWQRRVLPEIVTPIGVQDVTVR